MDWIFKHGIGIIISWNRAVWHTLQLWIAITTRFQHSALSSRRACDPPADQNDAHDKPRPKSSFHVYVQSCVRALYCCKCLCLFTSTHHLIIISFQSGSVRFLLKVPTFPFYSFALSLGNMHLLDEQPFSLTTMLRCLSPKEKFLMHSKKNKHFSRFPLFGIDLTVIVGDLIRIKISSPSDFVFCWILLSNKTRSRQKNRGQPGQPGTTSSCCSARQPHVAVGWHFVLDQNWLEAVTCVAHSPAGLHEATEAERRFPRVLSLSCHLRHLIILTFLLWLSLL